MGELREFTRYTMENISPDSVVVEITGEETVLGVITDLSTGGFSYTAGRDENHEGKAGQEKFFFVRILFKNYIINAEVERKWSIIKDNGNNKFYAAGVSFNVISGDDRLRLNDVIEKIRSMPHNHKHENNALSE